jgi:hypothetical protein
MFRGHDFAGYLPDDRRTCDEDESIAGLDDEVGESRTVGSDSRTRTADEQNLRHNTGKHDILMENASVAGETAYSFLHASSAGVVDKDERRARFECSLHGIGDLVGMHLTC